jgi:sirohydrochlorin ferrochelatase
LTGGPITDRPVILLAAHGERGGAANNARLAGLVEQVGAAIPGADVGSILINVEGLVERTLDACGARPVLCLPLLFSDGFFFAQRLKPHFASVGRTLAPPMALWRSFAPFLADNLALRTISHAADPRVVLVAHGSKQTGRSAACARIVAQQMQARYGRIEVGFLEEPPFASDVVAGAEQPWVAVGLFLGEGMHGGEDFDVLVSSAVLRPMAAFTAGELPGLAALIAAEARSMLAV